MDFLCGRFDHVQIPQKNLFNSITNVTPNGPYESAIKDQD